MEEVEVARAAALGRSEQRQAERIAQRDIGTYRLVATCRDPSDNPTA